MLWSAIEKNIIAESVELGVVRQIRLQFIYSKDGATTDSCMPIKFAKGGAPAQLVLPHGRSTFGATHQYLRPP